MTARQFQIQLTREWAEKMGEVRNAVALLGLQAIRGVVNKSPVDTGRFKGNWSLSIGVIDTGTTPTVDKSGGATIGRAVGAVAAYQALEGFPTIFVQNNLPYADRLEDGYSKQAPGGMLGLTVAELQAQFNATRI